MAVSRCSSRRSAEVDAGGRGPGVQRRAASAAAPAPACAAASVAACLVLVEPRLLLQPRQRLLDGLQVGEDQLGVDRLDVVLRATPRRRRARRSGRGRRGSPGRSRRLSRMLARNLLPRPSPSRRAADDAGDVDERHRRGQDLRASRRSRRASRSRGSGTPDDADVGLDGGERVVRREHVVLGQGVEQGATCRRWAGRRCRW